MIKKDEKSGLITISNPSPIPSHVGFPNLAGREDCDEHIRRELETAGVEIVEAEASSEVPYHFEGRLGDFKFSRAWYYWVVNGKVPLEVARKMYEDPEGKKAVRAAGHCCCPPPEEWAFPSQEDIEKSLKEIGWEKWVEFDGKTYPSINYGQMAELCNDGKIKGDRFVDTYHIDTQEGLNLFVKAIKEMQQES